LRHQEQEQLAKEQARIASLMSENQMLEEKLKSIPIEAPGSANEIFCVIYINFVLA